MNVYEIAREVTNRLSFCKFLSANDTGLTGGHQAGIFIPKNSYSLLFSEPGERGNNKDRYVQIQWQNSFETSSRFIYYGQGTRDEYRITRFGRDFPYLKPDHTGSLFILIKISNDYYKGFILDTEDEIEEFLAILGITPVETNQLIQVPSLDSDIESKKINSFIDNLTVDFPTTNEMAEEARRIQNSVYNHEDLIIRNPDKKLLDWTALEYRLFRTIEQRRYGNSVLQGFQNIDDFVTLANEVLNRRKSRAGKSLENHLEELFKKNSLIFQTQPVTEENKKPDFIFPSAEAYHNLNFSIDKIASLAAKTTCKDRWRQVLNEANRLRDKPKYLCTLQQGISLAQLNEMEAEKVVLVVPKAYIKTYPVEKQPNIWSIQKFIQFIQEIEK